MGIGDDIMATAHVRELAAETARRVFVGDGTTIYRSEAFLNNPKIATRNPCDGDVWLLNKTGNRPYIDYPNCQPGKIAFADYRARPGDLFFSGIEETDALKAMDAAGVKRKEFIVVEPNIKALFSGPNKDWGWRKWESLMPLLSDLAVVQFDYGKRILDGAIPIPTPSFRLACATLTHAAAIVTTEGGLHHAAAAVFVPGVVIWGGYSPPSVLGYDLHENIFPDDPESPCGNRKPCDHCRRVMDSIQPMEVARSLEKCLTSVRMS